MGEPRHVASSWPRLLLTAHGRPARVALWGVIDAHQAGDPLAPVTVAVPSTYTGLSLRREGGRRPGGLVNVRFLSLDRVAELLAAGELAASGRRPLRLSVHHGAIRAALAHDPGPFGAVATHPSTVEAFTASLAALRGLPDAALDRVAASGPRGEAVVRVARRVAELERDRYDDEDLLTQAAALVASTGPGSAEPSAGELRRRALDDLGLVIVHLPRALSPGGRAFLEALARLGRVVVLLGLTGDADADLATHDLAAQLTPVLGPAKLVAPAPGPTDPANCAPAADTRQGSGREPGPEHRAPGGMAVTAVLSCPDPDDEVRSVVREICARVERGVPLHRIAVTFHATVPYARLVLGQLAAAGIPHHGPQTRTLRETVAGRALLRLLALRDQDLRRDDVMAWLATAPVVWRGAVVPSVRWERVSCRANVVAGLDEWRARLSRFAHERHLEAERRAAELGTLFDADDDRQLQDAMELMAFVEELAVALAAPERRWADLSAWALGLLDRYLQPTSRSANAWPPEEVDALERVRDLVRSLAELDDLGLPASLPAFVAALTDALSVPVGHVGRYGDGVLVAPIGALFGLDFDTVFVLGMTEGTFPPPGRDDPLLPEDARRAAGLPLPRAEGSARGRRDYLAALAAASEATCTFPRADPRAQRAVRPAPWLLAEAERLAGRPVAAADLDPGGSLAEGAPWFCVVSSFETAVRTAATPASIEEHDLQSLLAWKAAGRPLRRHPVVARERALRDGIAAVRARARRVLGAWDGVVGPIPGLAPTDGRVLSPTSLELWAQCPFKYFLARVLHVEELERPEARDRIAGIDRGTIIHTALQEFVAAHPRHAPEQPWTAEERAALHALANRLCDAAEADGLTGRATLWSLDRARLLRELDAVLDTDEWLRRQGGTVPRRLEYGFGGSGDELPPLALDLQPVGVVTFRGRIDRVDVSPAGDRVDLYDYKTGMPGSLGEIGYDDPVLGGQRLQLAIYALALRQAFPHATVGAWYWFTRERGEAAFAGFELNDDVEERILDTLSTIATAVSAGQFPAYPGGEGRFRPTNCEWCPFDRLCPRDRLRRFERSRHDPALEAFLTLRGLVEDEPEDEEP